MQDFEITKIEVRENTLPGIEDFYIRDKYGSCFEVANFFQIWQHFNSKNGYRISFPVGENSLMTIWRSQTWDDDDNTDEEVFDLGTALHEIALSPDSVNNVVKLFKDGI